MGQSPTASHLSRVHLPTLPPPTLPLRTYNVATASYVCPTEIIAFSEAAERFKDVNTQVIGVSTDTAESHLAWIRTPRKRGGLGHMQIPLVADVTKTIAADYGRCVHACHVPCALCVFVVADAHSHLPLG